MKTMLNRYIYVIDVFLWFRSDEVLMTYRRPGVLTFIWRNFLDSLDRKRFQKIFVGSDEQGNKYYELINSKRIVNRLVGDEFFS